MTNLKKKTIKKRKTQKGGNYIQISPINLKKIFNSISNPNLNPNLNPENYPINLHNFPQKLSIKNKMNNPNVIPLENYHSNLHSNLHNFPQKLSIKRKQVPILIGRIPIKRRPNNIKGIKDWINNFPSDDFNNMSPEESKELIKILLALQNDTGYRKFTNMSYVVSHTKLRKAKKSCTKNNLNHLLLNFTK